MTQSIQATFEARHVKIIRRLLDMLGNEVRSTDVISWAQPIPVFGNLAASRVATVGINPSNKEFVCNNGCELIGNKRRFDTLRSLGIESWSEASSEKIRRILNSCSAYFETNPYNSWFGQLENIMQSLNASYYGRKPMQACHLDLVPFATANKWTDLPGNFRAKLLALGADALAQLMQRSRLQMLILNGRSVIDQFSKISDCRLERQEMPEWALRRLGKCEVRGFGYFGHVEEVGGIRLGKKIRVLGFNHNLQSSFGVTKCVRSAIADWICEASQ